jgi:hypothetical protein
MRLATGENNSSWFDGALELKVSTFDAENRQTVRRGFLREHAQAPLSSLMTEVSLRGQNVDIAQNTAKEGSRHEHADSGRKDPACTEPLRHPACQAG